jgi:hypothetical protein
MVSQIPQIRCRQIQEADQEAVADVLARGFPARPRKYWASAMARLAARPVPDGCPRFGYALEADGVIVGVLLLIFSERAGKIRCNMSSWFVEPAHRGHAALLSSIAGKRKDATYLNASAAEHTWPILEAQGYRRYTQGQVAAVPALSLRGHGRVRPLSAADAALPDYDLARAHADVGCLALVAETDAGPAPFVFLRRRIRGLPFAAMQLVWAPSTEAFVACAGSLGRALARRGAPVVILDAEGPIEGLAGRFFKDRTPRFFKGPDRPRLNDLAFTEMVVFGP